MTATLGAVSVTAPATVRSTALTSTTLASAAFCSGTSLTLSQGVSSSATQNTVFELVMANGNIPIASLDFSLNAISATGAATAVHTLSDDVAVTVTLTAAQIAAIGGGTPDVY